MNGVKVEVVRTIVRTTSDGYEAQNATVRFLIASAYDIKENSITGGPDWLTSDHYDVIAKVTGSGAAQPSFSSEQRRRMQQALLAERFHLVAHAETKDAPAFELVLAKGGPKFREAIPNDPFAAGVVAIDGRPYPGFPMLVAAGKLIGQGVAIPALSDFLAQLVRRPVIDKTGLTGKYDISLEWAPDNTPPDSELASRPVIFTALQEQLGLRLQATTAPAATLVIDSIQRPSEN